MTFLELCRKTRQECSIQGTGPVSTQNQTGMMQRVVDWVAEADFLIQAEHPDWNFMWAEYPMETTMGSDELVRPEDFGMWQRGSFSVNRGTSTARTLSEGTFKEYQANVALRLNSPPERICILPNNNLRLFNPADGTYTVRGAYWRAPTRMTQDNHQPHYPARFRRIVVARAKMFFFEDIESELQWRQAQDEYENWLARLRAFGLPGQQEFSQLDGRSQQVITL